MGLILSLDFISIFKKAARSAQLEIEYAKLSSIAQTTAMLAHDVRKPFTMVKGLLGMFDLMKTNPDLLNKSRIDIEKTLKNVNAMINDILDYSREVKLETKPGIIAETVGFAITQIANDYTDDKEADISIRYYFNHVHKPLIDEERIARVFVNILGNGIEAIRIIGKKTRGTLFVSTRDSQLTDGSRGFEIVIGNDGPPFNEGDIPKLFESAFTKGKKKGTGLGLASAEKIVRLHGGTISARNMANDKGVEFVIHVPSSNEKESVFSTDNLPKNLKEVFVQKSEVSESEIDGMLKKVSSLGHFKVLLLEDESLYRAVVKNLVSENETLRNSISLYDVSSVDDAIKIASKYNITHGIVDVDLGKGQSTGFDFLKSMQGKGFKSVVHTNRCMEEDRKLARELGASGFVSKPLVIQYLLRFLLEESLFDNSAENTPKQKGRVILYADDDEIPRFVLEQIINRMEGYTIHVFSNGEDLLAKLKELGGCDLVLTDQNMGAGMSGTELTQTIRAQGFKCRIFLVTNMINFEDDAKQAGADGCFEPPLSVELIERLF
ncbi:MAG: response regulator [Oligoflexales bacterium]|nr:response regulator [Oligoflexales bacterium]